MHIPSHLIWGFEDCSLSGFEINSSKWQIATGKSRLLPIERIGSKKLLPGNSVVKVISGIVP